MQRLITFFFAATLAILGTLVFIAGNQMGMLSSDTTRLTGIGCFMFSGLFWCLFGMTYKEHDNENPEASK